MKRYYITGVSGTGKSTLAQEFKKRGLNAVDLDSGFCSWKNIKTGAEANINDKDSADFYNENDWYCDVEKLNNFLNEQTSPLYVFGASANQNDFLNLFDKIFLLKCSPETFCKRIDLRTNNSYGKRASEKENELRWFEGFNSLMVDKGAIVINAEDSIEEVINHIISKYEAN